MYPKGEYYFPNWPTNNLHYLYEVFAEEVEEQQMIEQVY